MDDECRQFICCNAADPEKCQGYCDDCPYYQRCEWCSRDLRECPEFGAAPDLY